MSGFKQRFLKSSKAIIAEKVLFLLTFICLSIRIQQRIIVLCLSFPTALPLVDLKHQFSSDSLRKKLCF